jgi:hypothetical protein
LAAVHISALKFLAVLLNIKFPALSAFFALINAKSPNIDCSRTYFLPLNIAVGLALLNIYAYLTFEVPEFFTYFIGKPPYYT